MQFPFPILHSGLGPFRNFETLSQHKGLPMHRQFHSKRFVLNPLRLRFLQDADGEVRGR